MKVTSFFWNAHLSLNGPCLLFLGTVVLQGPANTASVELIPMERDRNATCIGKCTLIDLVRLHNGFKQPQTWSHPSWVSQRDMPHNENTSKDERPMFFTQFPRRPERHCVLSFNISNRRGKYLIIFLFSQNIYWTYKVSRQAGLEGSNVKKDLSPKWALSEWRELWLSDRNHVRCKKCVKPIKSWLCLWQPNSTVQWQQDFLFSLHTNDSSGRLGPCS